MKRNQRRFSRQKLIGQRWIHPILEKGEAVFGCFQSPVLVRQTSAAPNQRIESANLRLIGSAAKKNPMDPIKGQEGIEPRPRKINKEGRLLLLAKMVVLLLTSSDRGSGERAIQRKESSSSGGSSNASPGWKEQRGRGQRFGQQQQR